MEKLLNGSNGVPIGAAPLDPALFERVGDDDKRKDEFIRESVSYWQDAWRRLKADPLAMSRTFSPFEWPSGTCSFRWKACRLCAGFWTWISLLFA